jgi:hypothetical protein
MQDPVRRKFLALAVKEMEEKAAGYFWFQNQETNGDP